MGHQKRSRSHRASGARRRHSAADLFESALLGGTESEVRKIFDPASDRKTLQLCRQVQRAISLELAAQPDDLLRDLIVDAVEPMGSPGHLLIHVIVPAHSSVIEVLKRLDARSAALRAEVAASIFPGN